MSAWSWHVSHMHVWTMIPAGDHVCACMFPCVWWAVCQVHCKARALRRAGLLPVAR